MKLSKLLFFLLGLSMIAACVDNDFDEPPTTGEDPDIVANATISDLIGLYEADGFTEITDDWIIRATVVADDRSGNLFEQLVLEDETGGITLLIDESDLFNKYPVGRRLFIRCQGLYVGDFAGVPQLGGNPNEDGDGITKIAPAVVDDHVFPGVFNLPVEPELVTIGDLNFSKINRLIRLENVEFSSGDLGDTYADSENNISVNHTIRDCNGGSIILRTSGFSSFAGENVAEGNGELIAVYSVFRDDRQLLVRDLTDVALNGTRCSGGGGGGTEVSIADVRAAFESGSTTPPDGFITGVVISDVDNGNLVDQNMVVQNGETGIVVRFTDAHNYSLGQSVQVSLAGGSLTEFRGWLQVDGVSLDNASAMGSGNAPTPRLATVSDIIANLEIWESTLVRIEDAEITGGSTLSGGLTITDATGSIATFIRNSASFADSDVPNGQTDFIAIVSQFDDAQILFRNADDIGPGDGGGGGGNNDTEVSIADVRSAFGSGSNTSPDGFITGVVISDFENANTTGRNAVIQNGEVGIVVRFDDNHNFALGEAVKVIVGGEELSEFNGLLQVNNVPITNGSSTGMGTLPTPRVATTQEISDNLEAWESTLVRIMGATLSGNSTYNGNLTVTDASGSIPMFTRAAATFAESSIPTGEVNITAIVSEFNEAQVYIRSESDIE